MDKTKRQLALSERTEETGPTSSHTEEDVHPVLDLESQRLHQLGIFDTSLDPPRRPPTTRERKQEDERDNLPMKVSSEVCNNRV